MSTFVSKHIEIEAEQWYPELLVKGVCHCAQPSAKEEDKLYGGFVAHVHTLHGGVRIEPGDWIVKDIDGSGYYPCKPAIFWKRWEPKVLTEVPTDEQLGQRMLDLIAVCGLVRSAHPDLGPVVFLWQGNAQEQMGALIRELAKELK